VVTFLTSPPPGESFFISLFFHPLPFSAWVSPPIISSASLLSFPFLVSPQLAVEHHPGACFLNTSQVSFSKKLRVYLSHGPFFLFLFSLICGTSFRHFPPVVQTQFFFVSSFPLRTPLDHASIVSLTLQNAPKAPIPFFHLPLRASCRFFSLSHGWLPV